MHTVVIGNGIIGLTIAFRLAKKAGSEDRISVVGGKSRAGSATLAAGAMLNSFAEIEKGSLDNEIDLYKFELSYLATKMWPRFEDEIIAAAGADLPLGCKSCQGFSGGGCVDTGTYVVNNVAADDLDDQNFDAILMALKEFSEPYKLVSPGDIPNYKPEQRYRATRALYIENEGWFNPRLMLEKLEAALANFSQVNFIDSDVVDLKSNGSAIESATLMSGEKIYADNFIVAVGSAASKLIAVSKLGFSIPKIFNGVGVSLEISTGNFNHKKCIRTPNRGLACGIYTVPYFNEPGSSSILIGATNYVSVDPVFNARISSVESLLRASMEQINVEFYKAELKRVNVGLRPISQDTYPVIGKTELDNLIVVTGTKRDGFHLSPLISTYVADMIYGDPIDDRLLTFSPKRRLIRSLSRAQAVEMGVKHQMSAAYQHGFIPSQGRMVKNMEKMLRDDLESLHDEVGAIEWGVPPEMIDMYRYGHAK